VEREKHMATREEVIEALLEEAGRARTQKHFDEICARIEKMRQLQISTE
jgi:hypothetical protein